jgi:hypothetical protein
MRRRWHWRDLLGRLFAPRDIITGVAPGVVVQIDRRGVPAPTVSRKRRRGFPDFREPHPELGLEPGED